MTLEDIAIKHKTAKVPHGFMTIYDKYFSGIRNDSVSLLEVGVAGGASMKTWGEYFSNGKVYGLDADLCYESDMPNVEVFECNVKDENKLVELMDGLGKVDIIIDDGSHIAGEQIAAFKTLWRYLKDGGLYVIEDLFALYDPLWNDPEEPTIIGFIQSRIKSILVGGDEIQEVHWFGRNDINGIVFLRKRYEPYRIQPIEEFKIN